MNEVELGLQAFWLIIVAGAVAGFASWWLFRRWSDSVRLRHALNGIIAHLFELRLFSSEPILVLRAQRDLLIANGRLLREILTPSLILLLPFSVVLVAMDAIFGRAPLPIADPTIVTLQCRSISCEGRLEAPAGMEVETPPVHIPYIRQVSWRVRPVRAVKGELRVHSGHQLITKVICSRLGLHWLSETRAGSILLFLRHPSELPFFSSEIDWVSVGYPSATVLHTNWLVWFTLASFCGATVSALTHNFGNRATS